MRVVWPRKTQRPIRETDMTDVQRARLLKEMEQIFVPDYSPQNLPSADKRTAYALEHIAFRSARIDEKLGELLEVLKAIVSREDSK